MPLMIRLPRNQQALTDTGSYRSAINILSRNQTAVQRQLRRGGLASYEPATQATLLSLVQLSPRPTSFLDIGAHIGLYSAMMAAIFPPDVVKVTAFEPTPDTAKIARDVARYNRLAFTVEETALSSSPGTGRLYISNKAETSNSLREGFRKTTTFVDVPLTTLDDYCLEHQVTPGVVKIDVETFEAEVLSGGLHTLQKDRPWVVCELLASSEPESTDAVLQKLESFGYTMHRYDAEAGWIPTSSLDYRSVLDPEYRDWLLAPSKLPDNFTEVLTGWLEAIAVCSRETNILVPAGKRPPPHWDRPFPLRPQPVVHTNGYSEKELGVARSALDSGGASGLIRVVRRWLAAMIYPGVLPQPATDSRPEEVAKHHDV